MTFKYSKKLDELEELAEGRSQGRFSGFWTFILAILRSRYLLVSVGFYIALIVFLSGVAVTTSIVINKPIFETVNYIIRPPAKAEKMPDSRKPGKPEVKISDKAGNPLPSDQPILETAGRNVGNISAGNIIQTAPSSPRPDIQYAPAPFQPDNIKSITSLREKIDFERLARLKRVDEFQIWTKNGGGRSPGRDNDRDADGKGPAGDIGVGAPGEHHGLHAEFTVFQARYQDGDWNCNGPYGAGTNAWDVSALKNFMRQVRQWSRDRIKASVDPQVLDIGTDQIFTLKPPLIYLTGHKDFHFLDREVKNLRDYVMVGGCIWADSALAGRRSRFDIAFRREIKRVLPDREFETVKPDHEMFNTYFRDVNLPPGINFYQEPAEIIKIEDEMVVLYTLNGYGHFWESRLDRDGRIAWNSVNLGVPGHPYWLNVYGPHLGHPESAVIYRNINDDTVRDVYKFGVNVVVCLLTQYDDKTKLLPKTLPTLDARQRPVTR